ncbi:MAG TPA: AI-2E family transporter [Vicinamibacterales bacterium]|nr:AI-2E family transporter [Vicinamibacterales bacterium]
MAAIPVAEQARRRRRRLRGRLDLSFESLIRAALVAAACWLLITLWPVLLVLLVALMIAGTAGPMVEWLQSRGLSRAWGIAIVFGGGTAAALLLLTFTLPSLVQQAAAFIEREPATRQRLADSLSRSHATAPLAGWLRNLKYDSLTDGGSVFQISAHLFEAAAYAISTVFLALYLTIDRDRMRGLLFAIVPRAHHVRLSRILINLEVIVGAYIRGQILTCVLLGAFTFALLLFFDVPGALPLAILAGITDVLPFIGPVLAIGPAAIAALSQGIGTAGLVAVLMLLYEEFESRVLIPRIYGRSLRLPSAVVVFALLAGATLMGVIGAILALPFAAAALMLIEELRVELPGEATVPAADVLDRDSKAAEEYERRAAGIPAVEAAAIAVEIAVDHQKAEHAGEDGLR